VAKSSDHEAITRAKLKRANDLVDEAERVDEAISIYDEIIAGVTDADALADREILADAMFFKSQALFDLGRVQDALTLVDMMAIRFGEAELPLRKTVCHALYLTVFTLRREHPGHDDTVLALCDEAVRRFGHETDLWMRQRLLHFFIDKSFVLKSLGRLDEGLALRHEFAARYEGDPEQSLHEHALRVIEAMDLRFPRESHG
jgi:hypothetical protein